MRSMVLSVTFFSPPPVPNVDILLFCILLCFLTDAGVYDFPWKSYSPTAQTAPSTLWPAGPVQLGDGAGTNLRRGESLFGCKKVSGSYTRPKSYPSMSLNFSLLPYSFLEV